MAVTGSRLESALVWAYRCFATAAIAWVIFGGALLMGWL